MLAFVARTLGERHVRVEAAGHSVGVAHGTAVRTVPTGVVAREPPALSPRARPRGGAR
jgi:hypothetical protein